MTRARLPLAVLLFAGLLLAACGGDDPQQAPSGAGTSTSGAAPAAGTPAEAVQGMLALAEAGKWDEYVTTYYGEKKKMTKPEEQIPQVAARIKKIGPQLIEMLRECVGKKPSLNAHGTVATFPNQMKLYMDDGTWGFHL